VAFEVSDGLRKRGLVPQNPPREGAGRHGVLPIFVAPRMSGDVVASFTSSHVSFVLLV
jgi:hypothetical protein